MRSSRMETPEPPSPAPGDPDMDNALANALSSFGNSDSHDEMDVEGSKPSQPVVTGSPGRVERRSETHTPARRVEEHRENREPQPSIGGSMDIDHAVPAQSRKRLEDQYKDVMMSGEQQRSKYGSGEWLKKRWRPRDQNAGPGKTSTMPLTPTSRYGHKEVVPKAKTLLNKVIPERAKITKPHVEDHKDKSKEAQSLPKRHVLGRRELDQALKRGGSSADQVGVKSDKPGGREARDGRASQQKQPSWLFRRTRRGWKPKNPTERQQGGDAMMDTAETVMHKANI